MTSNGTFENYDTSLAKDGKNYIVKKTSYQYSSKGNRPAPSNHYSAQNVNQLDALLEDLKHERQITRDKDLVPTLTTLEPFEQHDAYGKITKFSRNENTCQKVDANFFEAQYLTSPNHTVLKTHGVIPDSKREYDIDRKIIYEGKNELHDIKSVNNVQNSPSVTSVTVQDMQNDLQNIALTDDILPIPGTKVTTTVRTYTYEIPGGHNSNVNTLNRSQNILYKNYSYNEANEHLDSKINSIKNIPATVIYNTENYSINRVNERPVISNKAYEIHEHKDTSILKNDVSPSLIEVPANSDIIFRVKTTENTRTITEPVQNYPRGDTSYPPKHYSVLPTVNTSFYNESNLITNVHEDLPSIRNNKQSPESSYSPEVGTVFNYPYTSNVKYKYTTSTTKNAGKGVDYPTSNSKLPPAPFPVEGSNYILKNGTPPQRVEELLESFGNTDAVDKSEIDTIRRKREIETAVASPNYSQVPSVNKAGKSVYYPPGHENILQKREEMAASSAGGGRWAKGSGMYEYESGYKSKTTTKSGGAMVPVCLPLCCAMPCSIM